MTVIDQTERSEDVRQRYVVLQPGQSPLEALSAVEPDTGLLEQAASKGAVWIKPEKPNGQMGKRVRLRDLNEAVLSGSELIANLNESVLGLEVDGPTLIDTHPNYSFWFKPRGVLSQGSKWGDHTAMCYLVAARTSRTTHLVHRLDRDACGIMVMAHTRPAVRELTALFATRDVIKRYEVVVEGVLSKTLPHFCEQPLDDKPARTCIEALTPQSDAGKSRVSIRLYGGRKHQIRRHLAMLDLPVVGDRRYGEKPSVEPLALMATEIEFTCPFSKQPVHCTVPAHLRDFL